MFRFTIVLLALVPAILATTGTGQCENKAILQPDYVTVEGCAATPCTIVLGSTAKMTVGFKARK